MKLALMHVGLFAWAGKGHLEHVLPAAGILQGALPRASRELLLFSHTNICQFTLYVS